MDKAVSIYDLIGEEGFQRLIRAFYRQVPDDPVLGPMYPSEDLAGAEQRLRDFLIFRFGGPPRYIEQRGHPRLRMRHFPFAIDRNARNRWVRLMDNALEETAPARARDGSSQGVLPRHRHLHDQPAVIGAALISETRVLA